MIHVYDDDERQVTDAVNYATNHGPFSLLAIQLNKQLKVINKFSEPDAAKYVGHCSSLNLGFRYKDKSPFLFHVWETINSLPYELLYQSQGQRIFGMSNQITNLWRKYGVQADTLYVGCDTDFWKQIGPKNETFTFLHINSSSIRSGLDITLRAFALAFSGNPNVKLVVKDTNHSPKLLEKMDALRAGGANIEYINKRMHNYEIRELYSSSHVCLNLMRMASFSLPSLECSACNCLCVTGDVPANNEIISANTGVLVAPSRTVPVQEESQRLAAEWGLLNNYPPFHYPEPPMIYDFDVESYAALLNKIYNNWSEYSKIVTRDFVVQQWTWLRSAQTLAQYLL